MSMSHMEPIANPLAYFWCDGIHIAKEFEGYSISYVLCSET